MAKCNELYTSNEHKFSLKQAIDLAKTYIENNSTNVSIDKIIEYAILNNFLSVANKTKQIRITAKDGFELDELANTLKSDIDDIFSELYQCPITALPENAREFYRSVITSFFDNNIVEELVIKPLQQEWELETKLEYQARIFESVEEELINIFGSVPDPSVEIETLFRRNIRRRLMYNDVLKLKLNLNSKQINKEIIKFKTELYNSLVSYLKTIYPNDNILKNCKYLYTSSTFNTNSYYYVLYKFRDHLNENLDEKRLLMANNYNESLLKEPNLSLISSYRSILKFIKDLPDVDTDEGKTRHPLKRWFENKYEKSEWNKTQVEKLFVMGTQIYDHYFVIKHQIEQKYKDHSLTEELYNKLVGYCKEVENTGKTLLDYTYDYVQLLQFDNLIESTTLVKINKGFVKGSEPSRELAMKYVLKDDFSHLKTGFESGTSEDSSKHTSSNVKDILESLFVIDLNGQILPRSITQSNLQAAFTALKLDVLNDKLRFSISESTLDLANLKNLFNTYGKLSVPNMYQILSILFSKTAAHRTGPLIKSTSSITSSDKLNPEHVNILYSFYQQVLNLENTDSILSVESERQSNNKLQGDLEVTSSLVALTYRNVQNEYLEIDQNAKNPIKIKDPVNWDSELFDIVSYINQNNRSKQIAKDRNELFKTESDNEPTLYKSTFAFKIRETNNETNEKEDVDYEIGFSYKIDRDYPKGIFSELVLDVFDEKGVLTELSKINLVDFYNHVNNGTTSPKEQLLYYLLGLIDNYLKLNILSEQGIKVLQEYKRSYKAEKGSGFTSNNYLLPLLKLALQAAEAERVSYESNGQDMKTYLGKHELYGTMFKNEMQYGLYNFMVSPDETFFVIGNIGYSALLYWAKAKLYVEGKSIKATTYDKSGNLISNFNVARAGSELDLRIQNIKNLTGEVPIKACLFVTNSSAIDIVPKIDQEITTYSGKVKLVKDMSPVELLQHAVFEKFYLSFISFDKVCIQPTVYSDKTLFLNYLITLSEIFKEADVMDLSKDSEKLFINKYKETFFKVHLRMYNNTYGKLDTLRKFAIEQSLAQGDTVLSFLRNVSNKDLQNIIYKYNQSYPNAEINIEEDKDYRKKGNYCELNEVLVFYKDLYNNHDELVKFIKNQQKIFAKQIVDYNFNLKLFDSSSEITAWVKGDLNTTKKPFLNIISDEKLGLTINNKLNFVDTWVDINTGELIPSKVINGEFKLNPVFLKFFYIEGLTSNNLRLLLSGSEVNHPDKSNGTLYGNLRNKVRNYQEFEQAGLPTDSIKEDIQNYLKSELQIEISDLNAVIKVISESVDINDLSNSAIAKNHKDLNENTRSVINSIYNNTIIHILDVEQGTLFKRNNIITATLLHLNSGLINGVGETTRCAIIEDTKAPVNNYRKLDKRIDAQDGSAHMSYLEYILENNSLDDLKVGFNRKPIWDDLTSDGTSFQAKFASYVTDNNIMCQTLGSTSSHYALFKKMHNLKWNGQIDLTHSIYNVKDLTYNNQAVQAWFKNKILGNQKLFYKNKRGEIIEIIGFGKESKKGYFTKERIKGSKVSKKVYHYFNEESEHFTTPPKEGNYHTIDSLYELFVAMGGIYSVDKNGKTSNMSLDVLSNFVINVGYKKNSNPIFAQDVVQPLKHLFISYVFNRTAVKNGAINVNPENRWGDTEGLNSFILRTHGLGIQLNADHSLEDSEITEFSQVIAACIAYGKTFNSSKSIYRSLAESAIFESKQELETIQEFIKNLDINPDEALSKLYLMIARLILKSRSNSTLDLTNEVKLELRKLLKIDQEGFGSGIKIPFSDPSLYTLFVTAITTTINKKSIKRKHPGSAMVIAPSYNMVMLYHLRDSKTGEEIPYLFDDILRKARNHHRGLLINKIEAYCKQQNLSINELKELLSDIIIIADQFKNLSYSEAILAATKLKLNTTVYDQENLEDLILYDKYLVETYLQSKQEQEPFREKEWFMPTDKVSVYVDGVDTGQILDLSDIENYYKFLDGTFEGYIEIPNTQYKLCVTKPTNLKPSRTRFKYEEEINLNGLQIIRSDPYHKPWKTDPSKTNEAFALQLAEDPERHFEIVKDHEEKYWSIHFKTLKEGEEFDKNNPPINEEQKTRLFKAAASVIPMGEYLSTYGLITEGGISGLTKFRKYGFELVGTRQIEDREGNPVTIPIFKKVGKYMTTFLHPTIMQSIKASVDKTGTLVKPTLAQIQKVFDDLHKGIFTLSDGRVLKVIDGSLEDYEAEIVCGNLYKDLFGIDKETLSEILEKGEDYFKQVDPPEIPYGKYEMALIKDNGHHTLITFDNVNEGLYMQEDPFSKDLEYVNNAGEIYDYHTDEKDENGQFKGHIKIGKYVLREKWKFENNRVTDENGTAVDPKRFRINKKGKIEERVEYVKKYKYSKNSLVNNENQTVSYTLYQIRFNDIKSGLDVRPNKKAEKDYTIIDALKQVASIISKIYNSDRYHGILVNHRLLQSLDKETNKNIRTNIAYYLQELGSDVTRDAKTGNVRKLTEEEIKRLSALKRYVLEVRNLLTEDTFNTREYNKIKKEYYEKTSNHKKKYISFLSSLHMISSRIPAQTLQSFMAMKCCGWVRGDMNTAYVSYILTYLLGSDY